jgi:hypothetical protein
LGVDSRSHCRKELRGGRRLPYDRLDHR